MEPLCTIRDILRTISDFELKFQAKYNVGLNEGMLLCSLSKLKEASSGQIAEMLGLTTSNTSKVIASAEKKKLIKRSIGTEDKRQMYFSLTQGGKECLKNIKCDSEDIVHVINEIKEI